MIFKTKIQVKWKIQSVFKKTPPQHKTKTIIKQITLKTILNPTEVKQIVNKLNLFWNICWIRARCNWTCNDIDYWFPNYNPSGVSGSWNHVKWSPGG